MGRLEPESDYFDFEKLVKILWGGKRFIISTVVVITLGAAGISLLMTKSYMAVAVILPNMESPAEFKGIAALVGYSSEYRESPAHLYPEILRSKNVLKRVVGTKYKTKRFAQKVDLVEYWHPAKDKSAGELLELTIKKMQKGVVSIHKDRHSGLTTISVVTGESQLSADIANNLIKELDRYNREFRKIKAKEQRQFIEERLAEVKGDLAKAENVLKRFREKNRRVIDSPALLLEQERLVREVEMQNTLYVELKKQYELVKIEEVKNTPVVNVLDSAEPPTKRFKPKRRLIVMTATVLSMIGTILLTLLRYYLSRKYNIQLGLRRHK